MKRVPPPSLGSFKSKFDRLCDEFGGPAPIQDGVHRTTLERACGQYPFEQVVLVVQKWSGSESQQLQHWPWIALAADQYESEQRQRSSLPSGPQPRDVEDTLRRVHDHARSLVDSLIALQQWSNEPDSPSAPLRTAHMAWLHEFLTQNAVASPRAEIDQSGEGMLATYLRGNQLIERLIALSAAAEAAVGRFDRELICRTRSSSDDSLCNLVRRCAEIWKSLTGRKASVNKVHFKSRQDEKNERPDFVLFVRDVARLATGAEPTFKQVATAFSTPYRGKKSPE